jgi:hypothetical protein
MKLFIAILFLLVIAVSCREKADKQQANAEEAVTEDSVNTERVDTVLSAETIQFFDRSEFSNYARSKMPAFDWSKFRLVNVWKEDSMLVQPFNPEKSYYSVYGRFLKYSPDSTKFIDLDSYNLEISSKNGKRIAQDKGPDTEVSLIDLEDSTKTRLVFLGPGASIEEGSWLDDENILLVGVQDNATATSKVIVVWKYHLPTNTYFLYESSDAVSADTILQNWRRQRLKGVEVQ